MAAPVDITSLAVFRILFGLIMAASMVRFLAKGWVTELYLRPQFHFPYLGFEWIRPWPDFWMHAHFVCMGLLAIMIAVGFCYRAAAILFCLGFTYLELLDQTAYLNHYYLINLFSLLLVFLPAHRAWSVDAWLKPSLKSDQVPAYALHVLRFQIAVVYIFAGIAKLNSDWLLDAQPLRIWLAARSDLPLIGNWLVQEWVAYAASWFGAIYDLTIVFFLLYRRTQVFAFLAVVFFHVATWVLFNIGMFPWIMIASSTLFLPPQWPRYFLARYLVLTGKFQPCDSPATCQEALHLQRPRLTVSLLAVYALIQITLPLRPYLLNKENPAWSYRGFNWAWHVMIAEKTGYVEFRALDPKSGWSAKIKPSRYITPRQQTRMAQDPFLIYQLARHIGEDLRARGHMDVQIFADAFATLNGNPSQRIIDPKINLVSERLEILSPQ
jgi:vitamin K-dependent gamma-carboxylase